MRFSVKKQVLLVIDDDPMVGKVLERIHETSTVIQVASLSEGRAILSSCRPYCIFLDVFLSGDENGLSILRELKKRWPYTPIIVATSSCANQLIADALALGADDFVRKPFVKEEVLARVQIRIEQCRAKMEKESLKVGDITFVSSKGIVRVGEKEEKLSPINLRILRALISSNGVMVTKLKLKTEAWDRERVSDNSLDRKLHELRSVLKTLGSQVEIVNDYGAGVHLSWRNRDNEDA